MKLFIRQIVSFVIPILFFIVTSALLPATPRASKSLLFSNIDKDTLLEEVTSPRIIFVGGSNLSFGLNSKAIRDLTQLNPINTGVHKGIGIQFMLRNTLQYIRKGDTVVLIPEYHHFFRDFDVGTPELLRTVIEVNPSKVRLLSAGQIWNLLPHMPKYAFTKIKPTEYVNVTESDVYSVDSFNAFGDIDAHWWLDKRNFRPYEPIQGSYKASAIKAIKKFQAEIKKRGAVLLVSYPGFQLSSYLNSVDMIKKVEREYVQNGLEILGSPERYLFPDSMMFDTPYHLNRYGVDIRTHLLVNDLRRYAAKHGFCCVPEVIGRSKQWGSHAARTVVSPR